MPIWVDGLSFDLGPGDVVVLLGSNGAGKSSTLRAITGLTSFSGTAELAGRSLARKLPEWLARPALLSIDEIYELFPLLWPLRDEPSLGLAPSVVHRVFTALAHGVPVLEGTPDDLRGDDSLAPRTSLGWAAPSRSCRNVL